MNDYTTWSRDELKEEIVARDLPGRAAWTTKPDMIAALEADDAGEPLPGSDGAGAEPDEEETAEPETDEEAPVVEPVEGAHLGYPGQPGHPAE